MSVKTYIAMRKNMIQIDKIVKSLDDELLIYTINKIADELDKRSDKREAKHQKLQRNARRTWGIIGL